MLFFAVLIILTATGCRAMDPDKAPATVNLQNTSSKEVGLPPLNLEDVVDAAAIRDLLVSSGINPAIIRPLKPKYTLVTFDWTRAVHDKLQASGQTKCLSSSEQKDLPSVIQQGAYQWYKKQYPDRLVRSGGQYRKLPAIGLAVGTVQFQGDTRNFFVRRAPDNSVGLVFSDPVLGSFVVLTPLQLKDCKIVVF